MIKAVILDLNGILIQSPKLSERFEKDFGVPVSIFLPRLSEIMDKVRRPNAGKAFSYWEAVLKELNINLNEKDFWDYWFGAEKVSETMVSFVRDLRRKNVQVFVLSNNFMERSEYYDNYPWMHEAINKAYFSWKSGFVKPDVRAWQQLLSENELKPEDCLYFDDQEKNLKASEGLGINSYLFTNEESLRDTVNKWLGKVI